MKSKRLQLILALLALLSAGISPNLFAVAQAGYAKLSELAITFLIPSIILLAAVIIFARANNYDNLVRQIKIGICSGLPGEMPQLMGVLMLDRIALGPNLWSNLAGWGYHFWNGAAFGVIFSLLLGRPPFWTGVIYAIFIGIGLLISPVVVAMGIGYFGSQFGIGFPVTVILAHMAFGLILRIFVSKKNLTAVNLWELVSQSYS